MIIHSPDTIHTLGQAVTIHKGMVKGMSYYPTICSPQEAHFHTELHLVQYISRSDRLMPQLQGMGPKKGNENTIDLVLSRAVSINLGTLITGGLTSA